MNEKLRANRVRRLFDGAEKNDLVLDAMLFANAIEPHVDLGFFYLTGVEGGVFERSVAVAHRDGTSSMVTSILEETSAKKSGLELHLCEEKDDWEKNVNKALGDAKRIGLHYSELTYSTFERVKKALPKAEFFDVSAAVGATRMIKDEAEIAATRESCRIASLAAEKVTDLLVAGVKEYEIAAELTYLMLKEGATGNSFSPISSFGPNSAEPHYLAGNAVAREEETVLLDFGCMYKRYASDITRTYYIGRANKEQRDVYETVLEAQQIGIDTIAAGADGADVDRVVREHIDGTKYKGRLIHSTGHTIGLAVHDGGILNNKVSTPLEEGMLFTVEPGIYLPGKHGVRIEDDILVTKDGCEVLTTAPKDLLEL